MNSGVQVAVLAFILSVVLLKALQAHELPELIDPSPSYPEWRAPRGERRRLLAECGVPVGELDLHPWLRERHRGPVLLGDVRVFPIQFALPSEKVLSPDAIASEAPRDRVFSSVVPGNRSTYRFFDEQSYFKEYGSVRYALTWKKSGWDCNRHYESESRLQKPGALPCALPHPARARLLPAVMSQGALPWFPDLELASSRVMPFLPRALISAGMRLRGLPPLANPERPGRPRHAALPPAANVSSLDVRCWGVLRSAVLEHFRAIHTTDALARYMLHAVGLQRAQSAFVFQAPRGPDYLSDQVPLKRRGQAAASSVPATPPSPQILHGFRTIFGPSAVDPVENRWMYGPGPSTDPSLCESGQGL